MPIPSNLIIKKGFTMNIPEDATLSENISKKELLSTLEDMVKTFNELPAEDLFKPMNYNDFSLFASLVLNILSDDSESLNISETE